MEVPKKIVLAAFYLSIAPRSDPQGNSHNQDSYVHNIITLIATAIES